MLKRETYIRCAGILLTLSPIGNLIWSAAASSGTLGPGHWYQPRMLGAVLAHLPAVLCFLWGMTFLAGLLMLKGRRSSWNFTLFILGVIIVFGITTFKNDIEGGWFQPTLSLIINFSLFALIYVQEFHQRLARAARATTTARARATGAARASGTAAAARAPSLAVNLPVHFEGIGPWAKITEITHASVRVRSADGEAPRQIEFRAVELALAPGLKLQARFSDKIGADFIFRFTDMNPAKLALLRRWVQRISARAPAAAPGAAPGPVSPGRAA